jgi:ribosomal protein S4
LIKKYDNSVRISFLFFFYKFYKNILLNFFFDKNLSIKINKKKNLFFKKKESKESLISKRISIVLKKRKKLKLFKSKKIDKGNFFLKKFFFKTLLKNRKFLKKLFYFNPLKKQLKLTRKIYSFSKDIDNKTTSVLEYSLINVLLRSCLFSFRKDVLNFINLGLVHINGCVVYDSNMILCEGDIVQLPVSLYLYKYIFFSKKLLKKKMSLFRFTT